MNFRSYLLDANILINLWKIDPEIFAFINRSSDCEFKVTSDIAAELMQKEISINGDQLVTTEKMNEILENNIVNNPFFSGDADYKFSQYPFIDEHGKVQVRSGGGISKNDYSLISFCQNMQKFLLVTEEKKILHNAREILGKTRVLNMDEFRDQINDIGYK